MDELKVVVSSVLEADEEASAQRITSQLPAISKMVEQGGKIKVGVEFNESKIRSETQKVQRTIKSGLTTQEVGVRLRVTQDAKGMLQDALSGLRVDENISRSMTRNLTNMQVEIDKINAGFVKAGKSKERLLQLTISGTDQERRNVQIIQQYDESGQKVLERTKQIEMNFKSQRQAAEQAAKEQKKQDDERTASLQKQLDALEQLKANWSGTGKGNAVSDNVHLDDLAGKYGEVQKKIASLQTQSGSYTKTQKAQIDSEIAELDRLVVAYQKAEHAATDLRTKDVTTVKTEQNFKLDQFESEVKSAGLLTDHFKTKIEELRTALKDVQDSAGMTSFLDQFGVAKADFGAAKAAEDFRQKLASAKAEMDTMPSSIAATEGKMRQLSEVSDSLEQNIADVHRLMAEWNADPSDEKKIQIYNELKEKLKLCNSEITRLNQAQNSGVRDFRLLEGIDKAKADLETVHRQWSAFARDSSLNARFKALEADLGNIRNQADLTKWTAQFSTFKSEIKAAGLNMMSLGDIVKNNVAKVAQWLGATSIIFKTFGWIKNGISTVVALDTAMIDLKKVTTATAEEYDAFYRSANDTAKSLNATTEAVISQTAEWARLGYSMQDAAKLAKNSMVFAAVSPGMDQSTATDGLVSIIKAYGIDVEDTMDGIISKVNEVGNNFAVSNADIVAALTRSSSAMAAANNTFDETVALATAAIEITRDAEGVGNGLKTLSMRIRGYDEETESYSDDVAMLTGKIADLTKTAKTPGGISLFEKDDPETYKSTYEILKEISEIWDELSDKNRAQLLEALFGKRQAQIGSAIISNFDQAEKAITTMAGSAGSAEREMDKVTQSIEYKLNALKETWVGIAQDLFKTDDIKFVVGALQLLSDAIGGIVGQFGLFGSIGLVGMFKQIKTAVGRPKMRGFMNVPTYIPMVTWNEYAA